MKESATGLLVPRLYVQNDQSEMFIKMKTMRLVNVTSFQHKSRIIHTEWFQQ